jgi:predicted DNA-binding ribbon-helix-helix protein
MISDKLNASPDGDTVSSRKGRKIVSRLVNRNVTLQTGRTSMRLEPELWSALAEICVRQNVGVGEIVRRIAAGRPGGGRTSAVRVYILEYFRAAATEQGHAAAGHGTAVPYFATDDQP